MPKRIAPEPPLHLNPMDYLGLISDLLGLAKPTATLPDALAGELSVGLETLPFSLVEQILDAVLGLEALQPDLKGTIQLYTLFGTAFTRRWTSNSSWLRRTEIRGLWRCLEVTHGLKSLICASALFSASGYTGVNKLLALWTRLQAEQARGQDGAFEAKAFIPWES